ncbi:hypothetical protein SERLA73DRAFT_72705 [Serpula lacrymans var. lacrymans S7.3]|uniref:Uncharacterized protein n=2 Tax=Serpula lacrymans var. lacrymans TaxID=341189 RepID=F8PWC5_SERL3|nr:uncharacterized protein SERLADRAFT_437235 [Serpula lacrymans var. lacrymans S7.9]EGN99930.1 hypothetical protein SERLA73DRAFT_72705 [Serpula lacrymans var. lacrymans S7.3]EGO25499.1 hypothetical protein SERLADRAFT_437235 [Serpula lacrymans var. lacrymans S7.9]
MRTYTLIAYITTLSLAICNLPTTNALPSSTGIVPSKFGDHTNRIHENHNTPNEQDNKHHHNRRSPFAKIHAQKTHRDSEVAGGKPIEVIRRVIKNADYGGGAAPMAASTNTAVTAPAAGVSATPTVQKAASTGAVTPAA